jgi:predicted PurR-regulated permease PerM
VPSCPPHRPNPSPPAGTTDRRRVVPWRPIWAAIASVLGVGLAIVTVLELSRLLVWLVAAGFLAVALNPAVDPFVRRLHLRRGLATPLVLFIGVAVAAGVVVLLVRPLVQQGSNLADDLPEYIDDAERGRGAVGEFLNRYGLDERESKPVDAPTSRTGT